MQHLILYCGIFIYNYAGQNLMYMYVWVSCCNICQSEFWKEYLVIEITTLWDFTSSHWHILSVNMHEVFLQFLFLHFFWSVQIHHRTEDFSSGALCNWKNFFHYVNMTLIVWKCTVCIIISLYFCKLVNKLLTHKGNLWKCITCFSKF